jgi:uncharacterized membrane-anchored protein
VPFTHSNQPPRLSAEPGTPQTPTKALVAAVVTAVVVALAAYFSGSNEISWRGILGAIVAAAVNGFATYTAQNKAKAPAPERGQSSLIVAVLVVLVVVVILLLIFPAIRH